MRKLKREAGIEDGTITPFFFHFLIPKNNELVTYFASLKQLFPK